MSLFAAAYKNPLGVNDIEQGLSSIEKTYSKYLNALTRYRRSNVRILNAESRRKEPGQPRRSVS